MRSLFTLFFLTVAPGGNNLMAICLTDFLGLATINMYYYYYLLLIGWLPLKTICLVISFSSSLYLQGIHLLK